LILGVVSVSLSSLFIKLAETAPLKIAFYRTFIASFVYLTVNFSKDRKLITWSKYHLELIISGFLLALHFALWISAFEHTTVAGVVVPLLMQPVVIGFFSWLFFKETVSKKSLVSLAIVLSGILIMNFWDFRITSSFGWGDTLSVLGTIALCFYFLFAKKIGKEIGTLKFNFYTYSLATVFLFSFSILKTFSIETLIIMSYKELLLYILLAVVCSFFGYTFINYSFKQLKAVSVAVGLLGEPLLGILWTSIFLGEKLTFPQLIGLLICTLGIWLYFSKTTRII
jgi:drug/metabolite transporter (DMT)-like permease